MRNLLVLLVVIGHATYYDIITPFGGIQYGMLMEEAGIQDTLFHSLTSELTNFIYTFHYTDDNENKVAIIDEIKKIAKNVLKVELIKGHNLSESKYKSLGISIPKYNEVSDASLKQYKEMIEEAVKVPVQICKI